MRTVVRCAGTAWFVMGSLSIFLDAAGIPCDKPASVGVMCLLGIVITISYITDTGGSEDNQHRWWMNQT